MKSSEIQDASLSIGDRNTARDLSCGSDTLLKGNLSGIFSRSTARNLRCNACTRDCEDDSVLSFHPQISFKISRMTMANRKKSTYLKLPKFHTLFQRQLCEEFKKSQNVVVICVAPKLPVIVRSKHILVQPHLGTKRFNPTLSTKIFISVDPRDVLCRLAFPMSYAAKYGYLEYSAHSIQKQGYRSPDYSTGNRSDFHITVICRPNGDACRLPFPLIPTASNH